MIGHQHPRVDAMGAPQSVPAYFPRHRQCYWPQREPWPAVQGGGRDQIGLPRNRAATSAQCRVAGMFEAFESVHVEQDGTGLPLRVSVHAVDRCEDFPQASGSRDRFMACLWRCAASGGMPHPQSRLPPFRQTFAQPRSRLPPLLQMRTTSSAASAVPAASEPSD